MNRRPKIDELVGAFLSLKARVWEYCDGDPSLLLREAKRDAGLIPDCVTLQEIAKHLEAHEASAEMGLISPVNETFRREWNDYIRHWRRHVFDVWLYNDDPEFLELVAGIGPFKLGSAYSDGSEEQVAIADRANFYALANDLKSAEFMLDEGSDEQDAIHDLVELLEMLWGTMGFSLQGAFNRASLAPVALVPPKVAKKITPQASLSL